MKELQAQVAQAVAERGYREGWTPEQYAARQICKAVEELDELAKAIQWKRHPTYGSSLVPLWAQSLSDAAFEAEGDFDNDSAARPWDDVDDLRLADAIKELPDIIIPLLVLADTLGIDLEQAIREKALGDVARGVRGEKPNTSEEQGWIPLSELRPGAIFETQDGTRAVKGEYRYLTSPLFGVVLLVDGSVVVFGNVDVREIVI